MTTSAVTARATSASPAAPAPGKPPPGKPAAGKAAASAGAAAGRGSEGARNLTKACLELHEPSKDGSLDNAGPLMGSIEFQFNPKELSMGKTASWTRETAKANQKAGPPQYKGPMPSKLTLEMFLDASEKQDNAVVQLVEKLFACCVPTDASLKQNKGSPPWIIFRWGELKGFVSYLSSVQVKYTLFTSAGIPVRATCTVTLEEIAGPPPKQNPTSGGLVPRRVHVLIEGDTLAGIAYNEYGDASLWRAVAAANRIDNPMRLRPGTSVLLPAISELPSKGPQEDPTAGREVLRGAR